MVNPYFAHEPGTAPAEDVGDAGAFGADQATSAARQARDAAWLARMRDDDDTLAFEALFATYATPLVRFAQRRVASRELAHDIVTDVMVELWRRRHTLVIAQSCAAYLFRAVANDAAQALRHARLERRWLGTFAAEGRSPAIGTYTLRGPDEMDRDLDRHALYAAVDDLPEQARRVAILRWFEELSHAEIAERLHIALSTVNNHLTTARRKIVERLAPASARAAAPTRP